MRNSVFSFFVFVVAVSSCIGHNDFSYQADEKRWPLTEYEIGDSIVLNGIVYVAEKFGTYKNSLVFTTSDTDTWEDYRHFNRPLTAYAVFYEEIEAFRCIYAPRISFPVEFIFRYENYPTITSRKGVGKIFVMPLCEEFTRINGDISKYFLMNFEIVGTKVKKTITLANDIDISDYHIREEIEKEERQIEREKEHRENIINNTRL